MSVFPLLAQAPGFRRAGEMLALGLTVRAECGFAALSNEARSLPGHVLPGIALGKNQRIQQVSLGSGMDP